MLLPILWKTKIENKIEIEHYWLMVIKFRITDNLPFVFKIRPQDIS